MSHVPRPQTCETAGHFWPSLVSGNHDTHSPALFKNEDVMWCKVGCPTVYHPPLHSTGLATQNVCSYVVVICSFQCWIAGGPVTVSASVDQRWACGMWRRRRKTMCVMASFPKLYTGGWDTCSVCWVAPVQMLRARGQAHTSIFTVHILQQTICRWVHLGSCGMPHGRASQFCGWAIL